MKLCNSTITNLLFLLHEEKEGVNNVLDITQETFERAKTWNANIIGLAKVNIYHPSTFLI